MINHFLSLPRVLEQQLNLLCGTDRSVLDGELEDYSRRERRADDEDFRVAPPTHFTGPSFVGSWIRTRAFPQQSRRLAWADRAWAKAHA